MSPRPLWMGWSLRVWDYAGRLWAALLGESCLSEAEFGGAGSGLSGVRPCGLEDVRSRLGSGRHPVFPAPNLAKPPTGEVTDPRASPRDLPYTRLPRSAPRRRHDSSSKHRADAWAKLHLAECRAGHHAPRAVVSLRFGLPERGFGREAVPPAERNPATGAPRPPSWGHARWTARGRDGGVGNSATTRDRPVWWRSKARCRRD